MPLPHNGPSGLTCPPEKKKVQQGEVAGHQRIDEETVERRPHMGDSVPRVSGERGPGEKGQWEVADVRGLHGPQQGLPEGLLSSAKH